MGVLLAYWLIDLLLWIAPSDIPRVNEVSINGTVLLFTCAMTLMTTLAVGLVPAFAASKVSLIEAINEGGSRVSGEPDHQDARIVLFAADRCGAHSANVSESQSREPWL